MRCDSLPAAAVATVRRPRTGLRFAVLAAALCVFPAGHHSEANAPLKAPVATALETAAETYPSVWLVEKIEQFESYSNGLRIENLFAVAAPARNYVAFPRPPASPGAAEVRTEPAGIVFHTTESQLVAFEEEQTVALKRVGVSLLEYVRRNKCYHFVVDRFGRVYRIVEETAAANHAGWSLWADERRVYVNLNDSFLAVAFEAQSRPEGRPPSVSPAQIQAGRVLTEMLRSKYRIPAANCVTHAQVSVNPRNLRIGYHTDWIENFPFRALGLPDNYDQPLPSICLFGFDPDGQLGAAGLEKGLLAAEEQVRRQAMREQMPVARYRAVLRLRWRETVSALENRAPSKEREL